VTKDVVFDSYAMLALFRQEQGQHEVTKLLTELSVGERTGFMSVVNVGEVYYITARKQDTSKAQLAINSLSKFPISYIEVTYHNALEAAKLKAKYKLLYADAFAAALTMSKKATLITCDREFKNLEKEPYFKVKFIR
jgi:predicted nucleic acid-binding protein